MHFVFPFTSAFSTHVPKEQEPGIQLKTFIERRSPLDNSFIGQYPVQVNAISYTAARENLAATMDRVCSDHDPVIITRKRSQSVVLLSLEDFESLQETAYLLRSPANATRLLESITELETGKGVFKKLGDLSK